MHVRQISPSKNGLILQKRRGRSVGRTRRTGDVRRDTGQVSRTSPRLRPRPATNGGPEEAQTDLPPSAPPMLGKPQSGFSRAPTGSYGFSFGRGHFYFAKNGDISISP